MIISGSALAVATKQIQNEVVKLLLEGNADTELCGDALKRTALMAAATCGNLLGLRLLLAHGASITAIERQYDWSAFHFACNYGHDSCMMELVNAGCDSSLKDSDGETGEQMAQRRCDLFISAIFNRNM